jgi:hypothetical protein
VKETGFKGAKTGSRGSRVENMKTEDEKGERLAIGRLLISILGFTDVHTGTLEPLDPRTFLRHFEPLRSST